MASSSERGEDIIVKLFPELAQGRPPVDIRHMVTSCCTKVYAATWSSFKFKVLDWRRVIRPLPSCIAARDEKEFRNLLRGRTREIVRISYSDHQILDFGDFDCPDNRMFFAAVNMKEMCVCMIVFACRNAVLFGQKIISCRRVGGVFNGVLIRNALIVVASAQLKGMTAVNVNNDGGVFHQWVEVTLEGGRTLSLDPCGIILFENVRGIFEKDDRYVVTHEITCDWDTVFGGIRHSNL